VECSRTQRKAYVADRKDRRRVGGMILCGIISIELILNLVNFGVNFSRTSVVNYPKGTSYTASMIRYMKEREHKNLFYRAETTHTQTLNDGALNHYNGVSAFTSSANVKTTLFMQSLGYGAKNTYNRYAFEESSPVANLFLGLKYMIDRDDKDKTSTFFAEKNHFGKTTLLENQAYLPLAFLAEPELAQLEFDSSGNAFQFQNGLFTTATGVEQEVWHRISGDNLTLTATDATITDQDGTGYCKYRDTKKNGNVTYSFVADRDGFVCLHLNLPKRNDYYVSINGVELYKETISLPQMIAVDDVKAGDVIDIRVVCDAGENSTMTVNAAILNNDHFWRGYQILNASTLQLTAFESTCVEGIISCDRDGLLYTSIPQNGNWQVTVDGREAETKLVGDCMTAVDLSEGSHRVRFTYRNPAFALGWKVSLGCAAVFAMLAWMTEKPKLSKKKPKRGKYQR
jgi:uncharacterized membrane protein YfhO